MLHHLDRRAGPILKTYEKFRNFGYIKENCWKTLPPETTETHFK